MTFKVSDHLKVATRSEKAARSNAEIRLAIDKLVYYVIEKNSTPDSQTLKILAGRFKQILGEVAEFENDYSTPQSVEKIQQSVARNLGFTGTRGRGKDRDGLEIARKYHALLLENKPEKAKSILMDEGIAGNRKKIERAYKKHKITILLEEIIKEGENPSCDT